MSAPAVPTADAGLLTSSTDGTPAVVSNEEIPQQNLLPSYASRIGTLQDLDTYIRTHYIQIAKLNWNTTQLEGTILYTNQIHPLRSNKIIKHLYKIFNTWTGGLDYKIKIAATGFNAGAIIVLRVPPNIDITKLKTVENMTHFPHIIIEAKTLEMPTVEFIDQLRFFFHYTNKFDTNDPDTFGGHFIIGVWSPLVAVGSGPSSVNIVISNKASESFSFAQIIPPDMMDQEISIDYEFYKMLLNFKNPKNIIGQPYLKMRCNSTTTMPNLVKFMSNMVKANGELMFPTDYNDTISEYLPSDVVMIDSVGIKDRYNRTVGKCHWHYDTVWMDIATYDTVTHKITGNPSRQSVDFNTVTLGSPYLCNLSAATEGSPMPTIFTNAMVTANPESFITFFSFSYQLSTETVPVPEFHDAQMYPTSQILFGMDGELFDPTQCFLFQVYDKLVNLPLFHVKLYHGGYMTSAPMADNVDYDLSTIEFNPVGMFPASAPVPTANYANMVTSKLARQMFAPKQKTKKQR